MDPELFARFEAVYAEFISLPLDAHGGVRVPGQLRRQFIDVLLDVMAGPPTPAAQGARRILSILTRKSA